MITTPLYILTIEDVSSDTELIELELKNVNLGYEARIVADEEMFIRELKDFLPDIMFSDYSVSNLQKPFISENPGKTAGDVLDKGKKVE